MKGNETHTWSAWAISVDDRLVESDAPHDPARRGLARISARDAPRDPEYPLAEATTPWHRSRQ
ncbi:MAG: hypothetical protein NZM28_07775, partial [Fimbriimonadales bacterium]|nr:hypothetical protein [Fimbriimonadales bacterium]